LNNPKKVLGLKNDLTGHAADGTYINFSEAFKKSMTRISKSFMMEKFFG
jgi:hypothetical protein